MGEGNGPLPSYTHHALALLPSSKLHEFLMLTGDKIYSSILQQRSEDKEQAHSHPDVNSLHVGHLQYPPTERSTFLEFFHAYRGVCQPISTACCSSVLS